MAGATDSLWTIDELGAEVALALSVDYDGPPNSRVRDVPDRRTIRYYTTLGLIDRPAAMRGRTALYGRRHLLQLVAIKRLQARGQSLAEIQQQLVGLPPAALRRVARLPNSDVAEPASSAQESSGRRAGSFWAATPAPVPGPEAGAAQMASESDTASSVHSALAGRGSEEALTIANLPLQGIPLDDEVILLFAPSRPIDEDEIPAIRVAAAPLLKFLHTRRLLRPRNERGTP
jgi:DNA-binding transcriptional MerR regulator